VLTLAATTFDGSPLFEGYLASVMFTGDGPFSLIAICRMVTDPISTVEIQIGSQELTCRTNCAIVELSRYSLLIKLDKAAAQQLNGHECIITHFDLTYSEFETLRASLDAIFSQEHGTLVDVGSYDR
jgi:hypothetical protein